MISHLALIRSSYLM